MSGGGLGEALPPLQFGFQESGLRTLFDLSFFVLITIIGKAERLRQRAAYFAFRLERRVWYHCGHFL